MNPILSLLRPMYLFNKLKIHLEKKKIDFTRLTSEENDEYY